MIAAKLLYTWDSVVESAAVIAITVLGLLLMVGAVESENIVRHLGAILCVTILLIMLPAIIFELWSTMSFAQHLGVFALGLAAAPLVFGLCRRTPRSHRGRRQPRP